MSGLADHKTVAECAVVTGDTQLHCLMQVFASQFKADEYDYGYGYDYCILKLLCQRVGWMFPHSPQLLACKNP